MSGTFGLAYLIWVLLAIGVGTFLRMWYAKNPQRRLLVFWVMLALACPPLAVIVFLLLKVVRIRVVGEAHGLSQSQSI